MQIAEFHKIFLNSKGLITDSRKVVKGSIFLALKGDKFDGHDFIIESLNKGAQYAISEKDLANEQVIKVDNTLEFLQNFSTYHRRFCNSKIIALTGTNGKTTTKELIKYVLNKKYNTYATEGNLNNHIGVPLTLLNLNTKNEFAVVEMGTNHFGEIKKLCEIAEPDYGLITNIGKAHLEGFGNIEGVAKAKGEMYEYLSKNNKIIFVNQKNELLCKIIPKNYDKIVFYNNEIVTGSIIDNNIFLKVKLIFEGKDYEVTTSLYGEYNLDNIITAAFIGYYFDITPEDICEAIASYKPENLRSQYIETSFNKVIMDAYNANPTSMYSSINSFLNLNNSNKVLILGSMFELGEHEEEEHRKIINLISEYSVTSFFVGNGFKNVKYERDNFFYFNDTEELIEYLKLHKIENSLILIKGSRANQLEKILPFV